MPQKIITQGAEAILIKKNNFVIKDRIKKSYRLEVIDKKLRKSRTKREAKLLEKVASIINVPKVIETNKKDKIKISFISGKRLSDFLDKLKKPKKICKQIGIQTALLHNLNIIHGDLTTSNMILNKGKNFKIYFIDFGLSFVSTRIEDKAVDIHLFKQALVAKHFKSWEKLFKAFLIGYKSKSIDFKKILEQLKKVESRGRYKH